MPVTNRTNRNDIFNLQGKVAVITGAAGLLGKNFCTVLADYGCLVAAVDKPEILTKKELNHMNSQYSEEKIFSFPCELTNPKEVAKSILEIQTTLGPINILHNNAATKTDSLNDFFQPFETYSIETWRQVMNVNVDAMFLVAQSVGQSMIANKIQGSIIQTSSIYGLVGPHQDMYEGSSYLDVAINTPAVYATSKAAVIGLTKYLATYWGNKGIRVNSLIPGGIYSGQNEVFNNRYSAQVPLGRMGNIEELNSALLFLASDASSYVTGQELVVDGGFTIW